MQNCEKKFKKPKKIKLKFLDLIQSDEFSWWFGILLIYISVKKIQQGEISQYVFLLTIGIILVITAIGGQFLNKRLKVS